MKKITYFIICFFFVLVGKGESSYHPEIEREIESNSQNLSYLLSLKNAHNIPFASASLKEGQYFFHPASHQVIVVSYEFTSSSENCPYFPPLSLYTSEIELVKHFRAHINQLLKIEELDMDITPDKEEIFGDDAEVDFSDIVKEKQIVTLSLPFTTYPVTLDKGYFTVGVKIRPPLEREKDYIPFSPQISLNTTVFPEAIANWILTSLSAKAKAFMRTQNAPPFMYH